ncbi:MAG: sensor histidine kinase [Deltaproteobacteria bacterium]|nr:sensor histidine kinase [Deltaproteobacteria bacterium]
MPGTASRRRARRGQLFWRVYLFGLLLLLAVGLAAGLAHRLSGGPAPWLRAGDRIARYLGAELRPALGDPARLRAELGRLAAAFEAELAVFGADHRPLAASPGAAPGPETRLPDRPRWERHAHRWRLVVPLRGEPQPAYLVALMPAEPGLPRLLVVVLAVLLALALVSVPFARAIVRPIEQLTRTARALAGGDLSARSGIVRRDETGELAAALDDMAGRLQRLRDSERELQGEIRTRQEAWEQRRQSFRPVLGEEEIAFIVSRWKGIPVTRLQEAETRLDAAERAPAAEVGPALRRQPVSLRDLATCAAERFAAAHPEHALELELDSAVGEIDADPALLRRVLDNLLDNAAKYSEPGAGPIQLAATSTPEPVAVEVRDRGIGVASEDLPRLFAPFFRTDRSRSRGTGGSGLGLSLCARILEAHGGRIEARLRPGGGLTLRFELPVG